MFNMKTFAKLFTVAAFATSSTAYEFTAYKEPNCDESKGIAHEHINVWDSTCETWAHPGWQSFKVTALGGKHQWATMYSENACAYGHVFGPMIADGSGCFQLGDCFNTIHPANAAGSRWDLVDDYPGSDCNGLASTGWSIDGE